MARFDNQLVLVTGGTSGIGLATAKRVLAEGGQVIATGSRPQSLEAARPELPGATLLLNDAGDPAAADALASAVAQAGSPLDAAFLNAGFGRFHALEDVSAAEFDAHYNVLVKGPLLQTKALAPTLKDGGAILITGSIGHLLGLPQAAIYSSAKGAVRSLVRNLARDLSPRSIRVNAIAPGPIGTDFFARTGMSEEAMGEVGKMILSQVPLARFGQPEEVAAVATFLLSKEASYVTGSEYVVDGGMSEL
ncbi:MAG: SDR family oxidoreductase [Pseudomonadota bacterium]